MENKRIKLSVEVMTVDIIGKGGSVCNPKIGKAKINFHYFGGNSVNVVTSGLPEYPVETIIDIEMLKKINEFLIELCQKNKKP